MSTIESHYQYGQHAAIRGLYRLLTVAFSEEHRQAFYEGFDSVPPSIRSAGPLTGPLPDRLLERLPVLH